MAEIAVAMLDVDEIEAEVGGDAGGAVEVFDDAFDFGVGEDGIVGVELEARVENRVAIEDARLGLVRSVGAAVAAGVGELEADDEVVGAAHGAFVLFDEGGAHAGEAVACVRGDDDLIWVRAACVIDGGGFATPDEFGAALAEALPAADGVVGGIAVGSAVPAFHGINGDAIADFYIATLDGFEERRARAVDFIVAGEIEI